MRRWRRPLAVLWALPNSILGLVVGVVIGGRMRVVDGAIEVHGRALGLFLRRGMLVRGGVAAITLGHIVLGRDAAALTASRAHERVHVRQYERWGVFFLPAYALASLYALARTRRAYLDNAFERQARRGAGEER